MAKPLWPIVVLVMDRKLLVAVVITLGFSVGSLRAAEISLQATASVEDCPGDVQIIATRGSDITYCYDVGNPDAQATLTDVRVTDDQFGAEPIGTIARLGPGDRQMLTHTKIFLSHDTVSFVTARATPVIGNAPQPEVSATASVAVDVQ